MAEPREVLREGYERWSSGDLEAVFGNWHPSATISRAGGLGEVRGLEEIRAFVQPDALESQQFQPLEYLENGERVAVRCQVTAVGAQTGVSVEQEGWHVWTFRDGKVAALVVTFERDEALAAAGIDPAA